MCPLWAETSSLLASLVSGRTIEDAVFLGCTNRPMTRFGIYRIVAHCAKLASKFVPSLITKHVSPHSIRHTTAVHLLRAGVDINTIRGWLGHVSLDTTHIYAEVDLEMKAKALATLDISNLPQPAHRSATSPSLMTFLKGL
jgi:integrase/recombinase XerD